MIHRYDLYRADDVCTVVFIDIVNVLLLLFLRVLCGESELTS